MSVPFVDLQRLHEPISGELEAAFAETLGRGDYVLGAGVDEFEREFASFVGVEHCVGVASGTAALTIALEASGVRPGDEVIVPAHTFIATALAVTHARATPVFCDVDGDRGLIDLKSAAAVVGPRTAAVMPVHLYGQMCDMTAIAEFAARHGLAVVEDAAQAHGARWDGASAGSHGLAAGFSFYPSKNLGALGDGGAICTGDAEVARRARRLRNLGQERKGEHVVAGVNERLDTLQARLLKVKLRELDRWNATRREAAARYAASLPDSVRGPVPEPRSEDVFHLYSVRVEDRDGVAATLGSRGVGTGIHYHPAANAHPPYEGARSAETPVAAQWAATQLSLPMFAGMRPDEVDEVCAALTAATGAEARSSA